MKSVPPRRPRHLLPAIAASVTAFTALSLLAACGADDDQIPPCPVSRSGAVDMVPNGPRPCVLGNAQQGAATSSGGHSHDGGRQAAKEKTGGSAKGKAPVGKQPSAPKAPAPAAPKVPSFAKR